MKISEFARATNVSVETVRYYHREQLLNVPSNKTGIRQYSSLHIEQMSFINNAKLAGFSLAEIKRLSTYDSVEDKQTILKLSEKKKKKLKEKAKEIKDAMNFLQLLILECRSSEEQRCPILERLKRPD